jgi:hypothetical protein
VRFPIRLKRGGWPSFLELRLARFVWDDPSVILDGSASPEDFRTAMSAINVGDTIKITGANRHPSADTLLLEQLDLTNASIVDIGASDGSTSVDLIRKLPAFKSYAIADLYLSVSYVRTRRRLYFFDPQGVCVLVSGPRFLAWPSISPLVRWLYSRSVALVTRSSSPRQSALLLNPEARELIETDPRVTSAVHDVFHPWPGEHPDVIKVANLLRRLYFNDEAITNGLRALFLSLNEGGHLLVVDNSREPGVGPRAGLYRRSGDRFSVVGTTGGTPEIQDLVLSFSEQ